MTVSLQPDPVTQSIVRAVKQSLLGDPAFMAAFVRHGTEVLGTARKSPVADVITPALWRVGLRPTSH